MSSLDEEIAALINRAREAGFLEFVEKSDVVNEIKRSSGEINIILYRAGEEPVLINAAREEEYVSLALLDLNLVEEVDINEAPGIKEVFRDLEDLTTKIGYELYGNRAIAPFLYPLRLDEGAGKAIVVIGIKSAVHEELFNESFLDGLIEDLEFNYNGYLANLLGVLRISR